MATRKLFTVRSLADMAGAKARKIETATLNLRTKMWRIAIGARSEDAKKAVPNRLTYRWVAGLTGWTPSTIGSSAWNALGTAEDAPQVCHSEPFLEDASLPSSEARVPRLALPSCSKRGSLYARSSGRFAARWAAAPAVRWSSLRVHWSGRFAAR